MTEESTLHLIVAAFDGQSRAEEALKSLKESRDEKLIGVQAAVALRKDEAGQIHFKDVGLTPAKGAAGGVVLGAVVGILTGGTGLALGALGALVGGLVGRKKRDSRFSAERVNQIAASLVPDSSAAVMVMAPGWVAVVQEELALLGGDLLTADIPVSVTGEIEQKGQEEYEALMEHLAQATGHHQDPEPGG